MKKVKCFLVIILTLIIVISTEIKAQFIEKKTVSLELAKKIAEVAEAEAIKNKLTVVISIVDDGGNLVYLCRMDNTQIGSVEASIQKAHTAISYKRSTKVFEDMVAGGRNAILSLPGVIPLEGGLPLVVRDQIIGAIGISGAKSNEDGIIAKAAVDFLSGL
jgi:glc operon protein GlcG